MLHAFLGARTKKPSRPRWRCVIEGPLIWARATTTPSRSTPATVNGERFWSDRYIQHSAHIPPGRDGLFNLVRGLPDTLRYETHVILAEGDYVIAHGRFSGHGRPAAWIAADVVRFEEGKLAEHWDVLQDEATKAESRSGLPMFGTTFPE